MANEISVRSALTIKKGYTNYNSLPGSFVATMDGTKGPTPGVVIAAVLGTSVSLAGIDTPGMCRITNLDTTNYVMVGIYDGASFFPLMELLPGESYVIRLCRHLGDEFVGTGTPSDVNVLRVQADTAACQVLIEAFDK